MGGVLILAGILVPTLLWADLTQPQRLDRWSSRPLAFGAIGFADDYLKVVKKRSLGLTARHKLLGQFAVGPARWASPSYSCAQVEPREYSTRVVFPFFKRSCPTSASCTSSSPSSS